MSEFAVGAIAFALLVCASWVAGRLLPPEPHRVPGRRFWGCVWSGIPYIAAGVMIACLAGGVGYIVLAVSGLR